MSRHDAGNAALRYPHTAPPPPGTVIEVAPGLRWLRMPLPFALDHINLWLIEDGAGWAIVDTGLASAETRGHWEEVLATGLEGRPVTRVIVTHFHPDHLGLAGWLTERLGVELWITEGEWLWGRMLSLDVSDAYVANTVAFFERTGADAETVAIFAGRGNPYRERVSPIPARFRRLADGRELTIGGRQWRVLVGRGHAPEHACLHCPELGVVISGDQVLPKISPNIGVWPQEAEADPLALFLASLHRLRRDLPADSLVLPSHGLPFRGLDIRIGQLLAHHDLRLAELAAACTTARSVAEFVPVLFRRTLDAHQIGFALGETLAHLHYLIGKGQVVRRERADRVYLYGAA